MEEHKVLKRVVAGRSLFKVPKDLEEALEKDHNLQEMLIFHKGKCIFHGTPRDLQIENFELIVTSDHETAQGIIERKEYRDTLFLRNVKEFKDKISTELMEVCFETEIKTIKDLWMAVSGNNQSLAEKFMESIKDDSGLYDEASDLLKKLKVH